MEESDMNTTRSYLTSTLSGLTSSSASVPITTHSVVISPCAACKILRRRCTEKCVLGPYFPPNEPAKFTMAHRVFGASNIIKFLQELPESQRADAVSSIVYEASARIRDPIYGCTGIICQLQKQVNELQAQLAKTQGEIVNIQCQQSNLVSITCKEFAHSLEEAPPPHQTLDHFTACPSQSYQHNPNSSFYEEINSLGSMWETLWT